MDNSSLDLMPTRELTGWTPIPPRTGLSGMIKSRGTIAALAPTVSY